VQDRTKIVNAYKSIFQTQRQSGASARRNTITRHSKRLLGKFMQTLSVQHNKELMSKQPATVSQERKTHRDCETVFGAMSKEVSKTFVPGDRSFKELGYAHILPGFHLRVYTIQLQVHFLTDANTVEKRVFVELSSKQSKIIVISGLRLFSD